MRVWTRASGALKDRSSIWQANLTRRTPLRNPDIEKAIIRATNHRDSAMDRRSVEHVCEWLRLSHHNLKPILRSLTARMDKTRSWPVALKGLLLTHALLNSATAATAAVGKIGRLPFDLSSFHDAHTARAKAWPFDAFVRAYYAFLDQKSATAFFLAEEKRPLQGLQGEEFVMRHELLALQKLQGLIDLLVEIKPVSTAAFVPLILDVMDSIVIEIYDVYGRICRGIAIVLLNIYSAEKAEAATALHVVQKATQQADDLTYFFQFCQEIRVVNAADFPAIDRIPEEGIQELEQIIEGLGNADRFEYEDDDKAIVVREADKNFETVITDEWEKFDEDFVAVAVAATATSCGQQLQGSRNQELPDLISF